MDASVEMKNYEKTETNAKLSWGERIAYGLGDYAGNLVYSLISAFLLVYYTEACGMNAATAASIPTKNARTSVNCLSDTFFTLHSMI